MMLHYLLVTILVCQALAISTTRKPFTGTRTSDVRVPLNGPCILNNNKKLKCTEHGYYEMVQCDTTGCFCVDAHNGQVAHGTRTKDAKTAPICSVCHNYIKNLFSRGEPHENTFIPKCDSVLGDYTALQCDSNDEWCFCVDSKSGKEIAGTKQRRLDNVIITCPGTTAPVDSPAIHTENHGIVPVGQEYCKLNRDRGSTCTNATARVMYFFDSSIFVCLAFEYRGCGGNQNRFSSKTQCQGACVLMDFSSCSGMSDPARDSNGQAMTCGNIPEPPLPPGVSHPIVSTTSPSTPLGADGCPKNYRCVMGAFFGFCCDSANEDKYNKAYHPTCPKGKPYATKRDGFEDILLGKSCSDNLCPRGYRCQQGDIFASCCPSY